MKVCVRVTLMEIETERGASECVCERERQRQGEVREIYREADDRETERCAHTFVCVGET